MSFESERPQFFKAWKALACYLADVLFSSTHELKWKVGGVFVLLSKLSLRAHVLSDRQRGIIFTVWKALRLNQAKKVGDPGTA